MAEGMASTDPMAFCDHEFQWHPASDDFGTCKHCGKEHEKDDGPVPASTDGHEGLDLFGFNCPELGDRPGERHDFVLATTHVATLRALEVERRRAAELIDGVMAGATFDDDPLTATECEASVRFKGITFHAGGNTRDKALEHLRQRIVECLPASLDAGESEPSEKTKANQRYCQTSAPASVEGEPGFYEHRINDESELLEGGGDGRPEREPSLRDHVAALAGIVGRVRLHYGDGDPHVQLPGELDRLADAVGGLREALPAVPVDREARIERVKSVIEASSQRRPARLAPRIVDALSGVESSGEGDEPLMVGGLIDDIAERVVGEDAWHSMDREGWERVRTPIREALALHGVGPSSGLPDEPSEEALRAARVACVASKYADGTRVSLGQIGDAVRAAYRVDALPEREDGEADA